MGLLDQDSEKQAGSNSNDGFADPEIEKRNGHVVAEDGTVPGESFEVGDSFYARAQRFAGRFQIEQRGIERVPEDERTDTGFRGLLNASTMWFSSNMVVSSFAIGYLGINLFYLGAADAMLTVLFFNLLGITPVCYFSTFGPRYGLRQMVLSRFWFGWWGVKIIAVFNVLACVGWSAVNTIVGAQLIHAVNHDVPGWAGILIISLCTFAVTLFGYKVVHAYEFWSWIPSTIVWLIVLGVFAHSGDFINVPWETGKAEMGDVLGFGAVVYGFATGWTSYAADYTVYHPVTRSRRAIFFWTWLGLIVPLLFTEMLGVAVMTAWTANDNHNRYYDNFEESGTGGLLAAILIYHLGDFGRFCLVVLALSIISNNIPNAYSVSLTLQVMSRVTARVPRFIWTGIATGVYIAIAIPGYSHFDTVLNNFMNFIGYWLAIYEGIALTDHLVFKRRVIHAENYDKPEKLPPSIAAILAFCCGIAGAVLGLSQPWFVGPIAKKAGAGEFGGDVGFELAFAFAAAGYLVFRPIEMRMFGR